MLPSKAGIPRVIKHKHAKFGKDWSRVTAIAESGTFFEKVQVSGINAYKSGTILCIFANNNTIYVYVFYQNLCICC